MLYRLLRPLLFSLDPESAHALTLQTLRLTGALPPVRKALHGVLARGTDKPVEVGGLRFANRLGLAAGFDKDGLAFRGVRALGFGHVELGTVTPQPQPGNERPRVFRLPRERSVINRLGFPSRGADFLARRLAGARPTGLIVGVNIGKQRSTALERAADDYELLIERFAPLADYLAINISSPNTPELRRLQQRDRLAPLLARLTRRRESAARSLGRAVPLWVKLSPDAEPTEREATLAVLLDSGVDGVIATNTTLSRAGATLHADEAGGLSGALLTARSLQVVTSIARTLDGRLPLIACGGVMRADDARALLDAGAQLVQLYTGLIFEGPALPGRILREL